MTKTKDKVVKLAVSNPREVMTHAQMRDHEFEPVPQLAGPKAKTFEELRKHQERLNDFCIMVRMALGILGQTKAELIVATRDLGEEHGYDGIEKFLMSFKDGAEMGELLVGFIKSAERRIAVAMHNVYPDTPGGVNPSI
jgi:hypothetical protein